MIVDSHVVIIIACLPQLAERGRRIYSTIQSLLGAFEMTVYLLVLEFAASLTYIPRSPAFMSYYQRLSTRKTSMIFSRGSVLIWIIYFVILTVA